MMEFIKSKGVTFLWICIGGNFILGLLYRLLLWCKIPITKGEPYGVGDILELFIGVQLVFLLAINLIVVAVKIYKQNWKVNKTILISLGITLILPIIYFWINSKIRPICF